MKFLILEDDAERVRQFRRKYFNHEVTVTDSAPEAIRLLETKEWDALFLDHDLGGQVYVPSGPGTGYEVAKWLSEHVDRQPTEIYLHTYNPVGRENMQRVLPRATVYINAWVEGT